MMQQPTASWRGHTGNVYRFSVYDANADRTWFDIAAVYIFAQRTSCGWVALYVGEATSIRDRLTSDHEKLPCARRNLYTHIHIRARAETRVRLSEEKDLIAGLNPLCND